MKSILNCSFGIGQLVIIFDEKIIFSFTCDIFSYSVLNFSIFYISIVGCYLINLNFQIVFFYC